MIDCRWTDAPLPALPADMRWFGWAGFLMMVPSRFRMAKISGNARKGSFALADQQQPRMELTWATVLKRRFDPQRFLGRRLIKAVPREHRRQAEQQLRLVAHPGWQPLLRCEDERHRLVRYAGYCAATERVIECVYHQAQDRDDRLMAEHTIPSLMDQPADKPTRWAMFDLSFVTPAGMRYDSSVLNIGDMSVKVSSRGGELRGPCVTIRQIYPAKLALSRQPLDKWMQTVLADRRHHYRLARALGKRAASCFEAVDTSRGKGLYHQANLRWTLRAALWRAAGKMGTWLIHDPQADRLIGVQIADRVQHWDATRRLVLDGLHWADQPD